MSQPKIMVLNATEALSLCKDARIISFRWDLIPWCLVLDMDSPMNERKNAPLRRAWMIFVGINDLSWSVECTRICNGIFATNPLMTSELPNDFHEYVLPLLAPSIDAQGNLTNNPHTRMTLTAKRLIGATSAAAIHFGEHGPDRGQRNSLATDEDLLEAIGDVWTRYLA
jgi:hypothetical protein